MPQNRKHRMKKIPTLLCALALAGASAALAQVAAPGDTGKLSPAATAATDDTTKKTDAVKRGPTKITSTKEASFDGKLRTAIFLGDVHIDDPEFTLTSDKLTVYMKKQTPAVAGEKPKPGASPAVASGGGGLDRAIAEGNVVIEKMQPDGGGGQPIRYVGKAAKVEYFAVTGDAVLSGWPQVLQGINMHVATEATTVMYLNREGRMRTEGRSETTIVDPGPGNPLEHK
jgi:lipopolysaccharide export system protein LptA